MNYFSEPAPFFGYTWQDKDSGCCRDHDKAADEECEREEKRGIEQVPGILLRQTHDKSVFEIFPYVLK
jgi:hypothetical protein